MGQVEFNSRELRRAFGTFLTGVTVVTTRDALDEPRGITANSFASVSLDPALVLVCIGNSSSNIETFRQAKSFAVNVLHNEQEEIATLFASRGVDRFASVDYSDRCTGAPILKDCLSWFDCTPHRQIVAGDHLILIGEVRDYCVNDCEPLGFHRGGFVVWRQMGGHEVKRMAALTPSAPAHGA